MNSENVAPIMFASFCIGCSIAALHTTIDKIEIVRIWRKMKPALIFCDVGAYALVEECMKRLDEPIKVFTFGGKIGDSEPVESLFVDNGMDENFV